MRILDLIRKQNYEEREPGLYSEHGRLKITWKELLKNRMICVSGNVLYAGYNNYKLDGILIISKTVEIIEFRAFNLCYQWDHHNCQDRIKLERDCLYKNRII